MDQEIRLLQKRVEEDNDPLDKEKLRHLKWRQNIKVEPQFGDEVEIKGYTNRTRGIFIKKYRSIVHTQRAVNDTIFGARHMLWGGRIRRTCYLIKVKEIIYCFFHSSEKLTLGLINLRTHHHDALQSKVNYLQVDLGEAPIATLQYGLESIHIPIKLDISVEAAFMQNADILGFDASRLQKSDSMFSYDRMPIYYARSAGCGQIVPSFTNLVEGVKYTLTWNYKGC